MPVKIGTMTTPASPFEIVHESGAKVQEKDNSFAEELFDQQSEFKIRKFLRAYLQLSLNSAAVFLLQKLLRGFIICTMKESDLICR